MTLLIFQIAFAFYFLRICIFLFGAYTQRKFKIEPSTQTPFVSVIIPARNEEDKIENCIRSFSQVNYPKDKFELIVVNDRSDDETPNIIDRLKTEFPFLKPIHKTTSSDNKNLQGKAGALQYGINESKGEYVLMTDADCIVHENWIDSIVFTFENNQADFIASFTLVNAKNLFEKFQEVEWMILHTLASAGVGLNSPLGCFGNNVAIKREVYNSIGTYANIPFSVTEDLALLQAVKRGNFKSRYLCNFNSTVVTEPVDTLQDYIKQHHRWIIGGKALGIKGFLVVLFTAVLWTGVIFNLVNGFYLNSIYLILLKLFGDAILLLPSMLKVKRIKSILYLIPFGILYMAIELLSPLLLLKKKVTWKKQVFK